MNEKYLQFDVLQRTALFVQYWWACDSAYLVSFLFHTTKSYFRKFASAILSALVRCS